MNETRSGFTLLEVIVALGIFALAIGIVLGLYSRSISQVRTIEEQMNASQLFTPVQSYLDEIGWNSDLNAGGEPGLIELTDGSTFELVSNVDGTIVDLLSGSMIPSSEQHYSISVARYDENDHRYGVDLRGVLLLRVTISYPFRLPTSDGSHRETEFEDRELIESILSIRP